MKTSDGRNVTPKRFAQEYIWKAYLLGKDQVELPKTEKQRQQVQIQLDKLLVRIKKILKIEDTIEQ